MKILLRKIRLTALYIFLYNLILIISIWLGKVSSKEEFIIAVAGNTVMMGLSFLHLHNQVLDEFHGKIEEPSV
ncbi:TPA: hypothetical protein ACGORO_000132 [Streptococcus suis]|uniref:hypothetical protein n=1 Tax=Streptococcus suis TaxID=1307 RepID=UPI000CF5D9EA|nr:hypothetical protein [Streptococcus suis]MBS8056231.1 hypothetical protein [Streptococcus suis]MBS8102154.1 hypothetical protein [Streptococcus suis]MCK3976135.1 hypothetical protein [Streptococcus suis]MCK4004768.1 hypothetical protein [Streptococcus suis]MDW8575106.1 hypothetical protein [Streptococcus suis]